MKGENKIMKKRLIDDLEKVFSYYNSICESCGYDCMKCELCFLNSTNFNYYFLCDIVGELILTMRDYYKEI